MRPLAYPGGVESSLRALARSQGPVLTDYTRGERVELNAPVVARWVAKVADLVLEETGGDHATVALCLPPSWRTVVWALGAVAAGAQVRCPSAASPSGLADAVAALPQEPAVLVSDAALAAPLADLCLVQPMPALALYAHDVPPGWIDAGADLMGRPDSLPPLGPPGTLEGAPLAEGGGVAAGGRFLLPTEGDWLRRACEIVLAGGSVVLVEAGLPQAEVARLCQAERAQLAAAPR